MNEELKEAIDAVDNINEDIIEGYKNDSGGDDDLGLYPRVSVSYMTYLGIIVEFDDIRIWYSDEDEREFFEDKNEYEPIEPYLRKQINRVVGTYKTIKV